MTKIVFSDLFDSRVDNAPIRMMGQIRALQNTPLIVSANAITKELLDREDCFKESTNVKVIRFLMTKDGKLVFAAEGYPYGHRPAHYQMTGQSSFEAECITAGNLFYDENNQIIGINNKSGDFCPDFQSLQFALNDMIKMGMPFNPSIFIDELESSGKVKKRHQVVINANELSNQLQDTRINESYASYNFSADEIHDLNALYSFINYQKGLHTSKSYQESLDIFYKGAVDTRLSQGMSNEEKASAMKALAHKNFSNRHFLPRLLADALLVLSCLTIVAVPVVAIYAGAQIYRGKNVFFSTTPVRRQQALVKCLRQDALVNEQMFSFTPPTA